MLHHIVPHLDLHCIWSFYQKWGQVHLWSQGDDMVLLLQSHVPFLSISKQPGGVCGDGPHQTFIQWFQHPLRSLACIISPSRAANGDFPTILLHLHSELMFFYKEKFSFITRDYLVLLKLSFFWKNT